ncbi:MAG: RidA family protein [Gammaproteobacteria bacterium]|nr:RidA family protein [Gammaproteobacteria bacterium]
MKIIQPEGWDTPKGYSNAVMAEGRMLFIAGQIGWDAQQQINSDDFIDQVRQTLLNTVTLLKTAGAGPEHIVRMTWYITDKKEYITRAREVGEVYREIIGRNYPAMAMVQVSALMEDRAKVEIESTAVIPFEQKA